MGQLNFSSLEVNWDTESSGFLRVGFEPQVQESFTAHWVSDKSGKAEKIVSKHCTIVGGLGCVPKCWIGQDFTVRLGSWASAPGILEQELMREKAWSRKTLLFRKEVALGK